MRKTEKSRLNPSFRKRAIITSTIVAALLLTFTITGAQAAEFSFFESVKSFLGLQTAQTAPALAKPATENKPTQTLTDDFIFDNAKESPFEILSPQVSGTLVVSQFQTAGTGGASDEFVEIHNVSGTAINLNGYSIVYRSTSGTSDVVLVTFSTNITVPAGGYYLAGGSAYSGSTKDISFSSGLAASNAAIGIRNGTTLIDSVGYGTATNAFVESATTSNPASGASQARKASGCQDTDNNSNDFSTLNPSTPRSSATTAVLCAPTTQASNITFSGATYNQTTANWTNGNGVGRVVKINTTNSFTATADGTSPTANTVYGGSGEQVVYNGTGSSVTVTGLSPATTYYFRVYEYNGSGATTVYNTATATGNPNSVTTSPLPAISVSPTSLAFGNVQVNTSSTKTYSLSGSNLLANITVTAPTGYAVSTDGTNFSSSVTVAPTSGSVSNQTIYVRFTPTSATSFSGNVSNSSAGATTQNVAVTGSGFNPTVNLSVSSNTATENPTSSITVTATASNPSTTPQTVNLTLTGTATNGTDYNLPASITIPANQTVGTATFTTVNDNVYEGSETAIITISSITGGDVVGSTASQTITITDDETAPTISINDIQATEGNSGTKNFTFTVTLSGAAQNAVSFDYQTADGTAVSTANGDYITNSGQLTFNPGVTSLPLSVAVYGDTVQEPDETFLMNLSNATGGATFADAQGQATILNDDDTTAPETTIDTKPANPSNSVNATFTFSGTDDVTSAANLTFECSLDAAAFAACTSPLTLNNLSAGSHTFEVRAKDAAGNVDSTPASYTWTIDTTAPNAPTVTAPANGSLINNNKPTVSGTAEPNSTVTIFFDGNSAGTATANNSGNFSFTAQNALSDGSHTVKATAKDAAGNISSDSNTNTFSVDTNAPTVSSIVRASANPTMQNSTVNFTVTFSESVTGVDANDFALTTNGVSGASITNISGSGATYTVSVNVGTGTGTVRLDVSDDDSITDAAGNSLGGTGAGNGNFTGGEVYNVTAPTITVNTTGFDGNFGNIKVGDVSAARSYTVSGSNLTADIVVTAPSDFQVSTNSNSGFGSSVTLTQSSGTVSSTTVYVRFAPSSAGAKSGNVTNASSGATTQNVAVSGVGIQPGTISFANTPYTDSETNADHSFTVTVRRTGGSDGAVSVDYQIADGTATVADNDYSVASASGTLSWADGDSSDKTLTITVKGDTKYETDEIITLSLSNATGGAAIGAPNPTTLTITNDDAAPTISIDSVSINEAGGNAILTVTQSAASGVNTTFQYSTADGTATAGADYTASTNASGSIAAGSLTTTISIPILSDAIAEGNETFTVTLSNPTNATIAAGQGTGTVTINDDDNAPVAADVNETATSGVAKTITLSATDVDAQTLSFSIVAIPAHGTLGNISAVNCNGTTCTATVSYTANSNYAGADSFTYKANDGANNSNIATVNLTVVSPPTITVTGSPLTFPDTVVGATSSNLTYTVSGSNLTGDIVITASAEFEISTSANSGFGSSVTLTATNGTVNATTIYVRFKPTSAGTKTGNIAHVSAGATTQNVAVSGKGVQPGTLQFTSATYSDSETNADHTFNVTVSRTGGSDGSVSVSYSVTDGTATVADADYAISPATGTLTWADGDTANKNIAITVKGDQKFETDETINLTLSNPTGSASLGAVSSAVLTITNDDSAPTFTIDDVTKLEGNNGTTAFVFTVTKTGSTALTAAVDYATSDGTATAPSDYTAISATTLTFQPADVTKTITVSVNGDTTNEPDENFNVQLSNPVNASIVDASGTGTIQNDDQQPGSFAFSAANYNVSESQATVTITVNRVGGSDGAVSVNYATADNSATAPSDYTAASGTLNWADGDSAPKTFTIAIVNDQSVEPSETINLSLNGATGGATVSGQTTATITIIDNDSLPTISKVFAPASIPVGGQSTVTLTLSNANSADDLTNASFTDNLAKMSAAGGSVGGSCVGTTPQTLTAGDTNLSFTGITIPANSSCTVTFAVTSNVAGDNPNTTSGVVTTQTPTAGTPSNTATLTVVAAPQIAKSFSPNSILIGGVSTLSITLTNPAANTVALTGVGVVDNFPAGLEVDAAPAANNSCSPNGTFAPTAGSTSISISNVTIPVNGSCTFSVAVKATAAGSKQNTTGAVTSTNGGNGGTASATLTVNNPSISGTVTYATTPAGDPTKYVPGVVVTAVGPTNTSDTTNASGNYVLSNLTPGAYTVTPTKSGDINGISAFDATLVLRCVAAGGNCTLDGNQQLAADANQSGTITAFDATLILRFAAANSQNSTTEEVGNWKFVPPSRTYQLLSSNAANENYSAVLLGDVNGSWVAGGSNSNVAASDNQETAEALLDKESLSVVSATEPSASAEQVASALEINQSADETDRVLISRQRTEIQLSLPENNLTATGNSIKIPVLLTNSANKRISSYNFAIRFDPNVLQLETAPIETSDTLSRNGFAIVFDTNTKGRIGIAATGLNNSLSSSGILLYLRFKTIAPTDGAAANLSFETVLRGRTAMFEDTSGCSISSSTANGSLFVNSTSKRTDQVEN